MQWLHGKYAAAFNERHGYSGHVFQGRYEAERVTSDAQLLVAAAYVALNPVAAGLCAGRRTGRGARTARRVARRPRGGSPRAQLLGVLRRVRRRRPRSATASSSKGGPERDRGPRASGAEPRCAAVGAV